MQLSQVPSKVPLPFAESGTKNTIPTASQIGITPGAASLTDGFPPLTFTPLSAGGVPPSGADFNGIFNLITAIQQWQSAGGFFPYDSAFAASIGGYPKGAVLLKASGSGYWMCLSDNNSTNPDTGGAGWTAFDPSAIQSGGYITAADTGAANAYAMSLSPAPTALTPGMMVSIDNIAARNTGAATLNVNGLGALPIQYPGGSAMRGGEFVSNFGAILRLNHSGTAWTLIQTTGATINGKTSLATNGYRVLPAYPGDPNPPIEQWGISQIISSGANAAITFPIAFPNFCLSVVASYSNQLSNTQATQGNPFNVFFLPPSKTTFSIYNGGTGPAQYLFRAIGY